MMYVAIGRLDPERFCKLEFASNFGLEVQNRKLFTDFIANGGSFDECCESVFAVIPTLQLLKVYRYFNWADKKVHSTAFAIDKKEDIEEDLLADFKDSDQNVKTGAS
jgi:hypothetical protein